MDLDIRAVRRDEQGAERGTVSAGTVQAVEDPEHHRERLVLAQAAQQHWGEQSCDLSVVRDDRVIVSQVDEVVGVQPVVPVDRDAVVDVP